MSPQVSFSDTKTGFKFNSDKELKFRYRIFKLMSIPWLVKISSNLAIFALKLKLPIVWAIKKTIYKQFCGGESIQECEQIIQQMGKNRVKTILDFSSEAKHTEEDFDFTTNQVIESIKTAKNNPYISCACVKITGICDFGLLEKVSNKKPLAHTESQLLDAAKTRLTQICQSAANANVQVFIDAEESWIQIAIDEWAEEMMEQFNKNKAVVFTTIQMYRHDKLVYVHELIERSKNKNYIAAIKLVRGAYLEKENKRAKELGYVTPMQPNKQATDGDYNKALEILIKHIEQVAICAGTHNENSCQYLTVLMTKNGLKKDDSRLQFSQLYGMSDHISYNLAEAGYSVTKYLPYGPVKSAIPYLVRRAQENTSIAGQMGKELQLTLKEIKRRKSAKAG